MKHGILYDNMPSFIAYLTGGIIVFFTGIVPILITTVVLIIADTFSGIWAALKNKEKITSARMSNVLAKFFLYIIIIICAHAIDIYMINLPVFLYATTAAISTVEFTSIVENVYKATGINLIKVITKFIKKGRDEHI